MEWYWKSETVKKFLSFGSVGGSGVVVNLVSLQALNISGITGVGASAIASMVAMVGNYYLNDVLTFSDTQRTLSVAARARHLSVFVSISLLGILTTSMVYKALTDQGVTSWMAQLIGIFLTSLWTFALHRRITWPTQGQTASKAI